MTLECPSCGSDMVLRVARRGRNAGNEFWGCSSYPACRGTRDLDQVAVDEAAPDLTQQFAGSAGSPIASSLKTRVEWIEPTARNRWDTLYVVGGGSLRSTSLVSDVLEKQYPEALPRLQQSFIAVSPAALPRHDDPGVTQVIGTFRKLLQRGDAPPHGPEVERSLVERLGLMEVVPSDDPGDDAFSIDAHALPLTEEEIVSSALLSASDFRPRDDLMYDSPEERSFVEWMAESFGTEVARWLYPQAPFSALLGDPTDARRSDFLFAPPWRSPIVIEIDGIHHDSQLGVDEERDEDLREAGFQVARIGAAQIRARDRSAIPDVSHVSGPMPGLAAQLAVHGPAQVTRLGLAMAEAVERGFLPLGDAWRLRIEDRLDVAGYALAPLLEILASIDELWAGYVAPPEVHVATTSESFVLVRTSQAAYQRESGIESSPIDVMIRLEHDRGPHDALEAAESPTIVIRPASLPVSLADRRAEGSAMAVARDVRSLEEPLRRVLRYVFAKKHFKEGQFNAISQTLRGRDCLVLLPTGAGKSLIYQMAGLLMPGRTLIIDPLVALMEDQVEGLRSFGIDRAVAISSYLTQQGLVDMALDQMRNGDALFFFISPERLQTQGFRDSLQALTATTPINVTVVDEAHCISEWGHDFRPAYLNLGPLIRRLSKSSSGSPPPILALTGTASRAVLRDVLIELDLDRRDPDSVIKPESFERQELSFEVVSAAPGESTARLIGAVKSIPHSLGARPGQFFDRVSRPANLGVVFCPHVNGEFGVIEVARKLRSAVTPYINSYAGGPPRGADPQKWQHQKREIALAFRQGKVILLCATKAFGMGIDIPNVRYTVHLGIPSSIEAFYQEAGRAGRDRRKSRCVVVFTERNARTNERLLSDSTEGEEARSIYEGQTRAEDDDIRRQLFFFFKTFKGRDRETESVVDVMREIEWTGSAKSVDVAFSDDAELRERAILRLMQIGVVRDYLKEWGSKMFRLQLAEAGREDLDEAYLAFVARTQPGRLEERRQAVASLPPDLSDRALFLASMAVEMVYDSVEKSRRRALREMRLLSAAGATDTEIRRRIEDYFREGDLAPQLEQLTEVTDMTIEEWATVLTGLTVADEGELRGSTARLLESYPDHPGLLLGRALAELIAGDNRYEFSDNLGRAFEFGEARYSLSQKDLVRMASLMLDFASVHTPSWRPMVWERALPLISEGDQWHLLIRPTEDNKAVAGERVMDLMQRTRSGLQSARALVAHLSEEGGRDE